MKTTRNFLTTLLAAGTAGVAALAFANVLSVEAALATLAAAGLVAFAVADYSRRFASLHVKAAILRPTLPVRTLAPVAARRAA